MQAGAARLADRIQMSDTRAAVEIRVHAAAGKMRRRHDRNRLPRDVDAVLEAALVDGRESARG